MKKTISLLLVLITIVALSACSGVEFSLVGEQSFTVSNNENFVDPGFIAKDGNTDLSEFVEVSYEANSSNDVDFIITYELNYDEKTEVLQRLVNFESFSCVPVPDTDVTQCNINFDQYLHTYIKLTIYYSDDSVHETMNTVFQNVEDIIATYHKLSDKYDNYDGVINVKSVNDNPTETHTIDPLLFDMIDFALDHQEEVDNMFNIALGPVLQVWHDYRELADPFTNQASSAPTLTELTEQNQYTDSSKVRLDQSNYTITMEENMSLDLGGMSKGYISEKIVQYLDTLDFDAYLLNNGNSNISIGGTHPLRDHGKFVLAATDPTGEKYPGYATILLEDGEQLVTSGDYQQFFMVGDTLYHHIINPITLMPERYSRSVSIVINGDAGLADLYSTALFTMTIEDGLTFVNKTPGLEAIWYGLDGTITFSEHFEEQHLGMIIE